MYVNGRCINKNVANIRYLSQKWMILIYVDKLKFYYWDKIRFSLSEMTLETTFFVYIFMMTQPSAKSSVFLRVERFTASNERVFSKLHFQQNISYKYLSEVKRRLFVQGFIYSQSPIVYVKMCSINWLEIIIGTNWRHLNSEICNNSKAQFVTVITRVHSKIGIY